MLRTDYLTEEYILCRAQAFDYQRERRFGNRCTDEELLGVILATVSLLHASMRTLPERCQLHPQTGPSGISISDSRVSHALMTY